MDQAVPRGAGPNRRAVEHPVFGGGEPFGHRLSDRRGVQREDGGVDPIPKVVQRRSAGLDSLTEPSQGIVDRDVACPLCRREASFEILVQNHLQHEIGAIGQRPDSRVALIQGRLIQSVHEVVDQACAMIQPQRGAPSTPERGAAGRGRDGESAFLVTELRLAWSSWPPCVTTIKSVADHMRFAKTQGGHVSLPCRLSPQNSWTISARGGVIPPSRRRNQPGRPPSPSRIGNSMFTVLSLR